MGSFPENFQEIEGSFFFTADDGNGRIWYKMEADDAVVAVTPKKQGLPIDAEKDIFYYKVSWNNGGGDFGNDLWGFDGTRAMQVADTNPGGNDGVGGDLVPFKGGIIFTASDGIEIRTYYFKAGMSEPMKLDGPLPQFQETLPILNDVFYYSQQFPATKLWSFDDVEAKEVPGQPFAEANYFYPVGLADRYLVIGHGFSDNWLFDGAMFFQPTLPAELGGGSLAQALIEAKEADGEYYFKVLGEGGSSTNVVWDGGTEFTALSDSYGNNSSSRLLPLLSFSGEIFLIEGNPATEVYTYDGTSVTLFEGENVDRLAGLGNSTTFQGKLLFVGADPIDPVTRLLHFDGVNVQRASSEDPGPNINGAEFTEYKDKLYIGGGSSSSTILSYVFDGVNFAPAGFTGSYQTVFGDLFCYTAKTTDSGIARELWSWDGVNDPIPFRIHPSTGNGSNPRGLTVVGDKLYFSANDSPTGYHLIINYGNSMGPTPLSKWLRIQAEPADPKSFWIGTVSCFLRLNLQ